MRHLLLVVCAALALTSTGCVSQSVKNKHTLSQASGTFTAPVEVKVVVREGVKTRASDDLKGLVEKQLAKSFKKQRIQTASTASSVVNVEVIGAKGMTGAERFFVGNFGPKDWIEAVVTWSDGSSVQLTGKAGLGYYMPWVVGSEIVDAAQALADDVAKETKARLVK